MEITLFFSAQQYFIKSDELATRTSKDLNFVLLPSALRQNLDKEIKESPKIHKTNPTKFPRF